MEDRLLESDLYGPVRDYLAALGYEVKGEVRDCDIAAVRDGELIVVELKRGFTLELLYQALERQKIADGVYVAVPLPRRGYLAPHMREMQALCRRLELGLIFVGFSSGGVAQVDVAVHPREAPRPRPDRRERLAVIREHQGRTGSRNTGGVTRRKILTLYKEQALQVARILRDGGAMTVEAVRAAGGPETTGTILGRNAIGWFDREDAGNRRYLYRVNGEGLAALETYKDLL